MGLILYMQHSTNKQPSSFVPSIIRFSVCHLKYNVDRCLLNLFLKSQFEVWGVHKLTIRCHSFKTGIHILWGSFVFRDRQTERNKKLQICHLVMYKEPNIPKMRCSSQTPFIKGETSNCCDRHVMIYSIQLGLLTGMKISREFFFFFFYEARLLFRGIFSDQVSVHLPTKTSYYSFVSAAENLMEMPKGILSDV